MSHSAPLSTLQPRNPQNNHMRSLWSQLEDHMRGGYQSMRNARPLVLHAILDEWVLYLLNDHIQAISTLAVIHAASLSKYRVTQGRQVWPLFLNEPTMAVSQRGSWHNRNSPGGSVCVCLCAHVCVHVCARVEGEVQKGKISEWPMFAWEGFHPIHETSPSISLKIHASQGAGPLGNDFSQVGSTRRWQQGPELILPWNVETSKAEWNAPLKVTWKKNKFRG